ncbi:hypothetical protein N510_001979 [Firmicutes bacterium ASF500]|nr:hypothetical protein N510_001979 [Firmicutes bacterium ASF500]
MNNRPLRLLASVAAVLIFLFFTAILLLYARPRGESSYSFELGGFGELEGDYMLSAEDYDQKGWTVFVQEGQRCRELTADGFGGFSGLSFLGQTFYFSRVMTEEVRQPVLTLDAANRSVVVFLDDELLYSDAPAQDNRIGHLNLTFLPWDRDVVTVSLPPDYLGKTLTVAQSSGNPETQALPPIEELRVYPCVVTLAEAYAQEQELISAGFSTALTVALCFSLGLTALSSFLWQGFHQVWNPSLALLSLAGFVLMASRILSAQFFYFFFPELFLDLKAVCWSVFLSLLLVYLGYQGGWGRQLLWALAGVSAGSALPGLFFPDSLWLTLSEWSGLLGLAAALVLSLTWRKSGLPFFRLFTPMLLAVLSAAGTAILIGCLLSPSLRYYLWTQLLAVFTMGLCRFFLWRLAVLFLLPTIVAETVFFLRWDTQRRTERQLLLQQGERAMENYENLRRHSQELAPLRHDLRHHCAVLRGLCHSGELDRISDYLDTISAWTQPPEGDYTIHPVVNIILTDFLRRCRELDIRASVRVELPPHLPVPDADLCALLTNLLENAVEANKKIPEGVERWLRVAIHIRGQYLYIGVENARFHPVRRSGEQDLPHSDKPGAGHGLGLRSARSIARKYNSELRLKAPPGPFSASTALLLPEESDSAPSLSAAARS